MCLTDSSFAYYRFPYADCYTLIEQDGMPSVLQGYAEIGKDAGFVIAPFAQNDALPVVLLRPERVSSVVLDMEDVQPNASLSTAESVPDAAYQKAFDAFHSAVSGGRFAKLVLARKRIVKREAGTFSRKDAHDMFLRICRMYPRLMVMLFSSPLTGMWIVATPEVLVEKKGDNCRTMALAGTMTYRDGVAEWSEKNKHEQHVVEQYIENIISPISTRIVKDGPATARAGNLVHLRTEFRFRLADGCSFGKLVDSLHPTPAVCGVPTDEARSFINSNEPASRRYYSGFAGPVNMNGESHLYVSLRCAEITGDEMVAYAGGGIMTESECVAEWRETEEKMKTVLS